MVGGRRSTRSDRSGIAVDSEVPVMFLMRFDLRAPGAGTSAVDRYAAALDMVAYAESRGAVSVLVSEHHGRADGYLPAPLLIASAIAARTSSIPILTSALLLPLYDPVRLAEDLIVLDIVSRGRASHVLVVGYRPDEFARMGVDFHRRGRIADAHLEVLLRAKTGEAFDRDGRRIQVTPPPFTPGGPRVHIGGGSPAAARRAGRHGLDFYAQGGGRELVELYRAACRANGHAPGVCLMPPPDLPTTVFVADDLDTAWHELGPHLLDDVRSYAAPGSDVAATASLSGATSVDELRAEKASHRILTVDEAVAFIRAGNILQLHPLAGGLAPRVAWRYLRNVTERVMPRL
jgi:alkanesulfonate monooxygenase SsuD/methylene tetrahydromethanopterin reductase-like flavin-dependent oxidoreductase (luciferase family)